MRVLAGDIGGTKTAIATVDVSGTRCRVRRLVRYPSGDYPGLEEIVETFLADESSRPKAAGFGVAGPVQNGIARVTQLSWRPVDPARLSRRLGVRRVVVVNDFRAAAFGLAYMERRQLATLVPGRAEPGGQVAILGAGTGLGQAGVLLCGGKRVVADSEGGHVEFGPRNETEDRLAAFLRRRFGRATREQVLSGRGLTSIYAFLKEEEKAAPENPKVAEAFRTEDDAAVISRFGLADRNSLCGLALQMFVSLYGSEAGNLAIQYRATGGVYVGGGIAPRILPALRRPEFLRSFRAKPPMDKLVSRIPVRAVLDWRLGLFGAAASVIE